MDPEDEVKVLKQLVSEHDNIMPSLQLSDQYYSGQQPLQYMHPELWAEVADRIKPVILNWPRLVVDALEERLDIEGFRYAQADKPDAELWRVWQANNLDEWSQQGHIDALALQYFCTIVGTNPEDAQTPIISVETPLECYVQRDPATRLGRAAVKRWKDAGETLGGKEQQFATLYLPNSTIQYLLEHNQWVEQERDDHSLGRIPVSVGANRPRLQNLLGISELSDVIPLSDAACKLATDMMVAAEFNAVPQRWVFGMDKSDFVDPQTGQQLGTWRAIMGRIWSTKNTEAKAGVFPAADLSNFHNSIDSLAKVVMAMSGLTPQHFGFTSDNPASADAIRSADMRLVKRAERRQRTFGGCWEDTNRVMRRFQTGEWSPAERSIETVWRDPSTPTVAESADAAVKKYQTGIVPWRQTVEDLGYSEAQIERMAAFRMTESPLSQLAMATNPQAINPTPEPDAVQ